MSVRKIKEFVVSSEGAEVIIKTDIGIFKVIAYATDGWINTHKGALHIEDAEDAKRAAKLLHAAYREVQARQGRKVWKL